MVLHVFFHCFSLIVFVLQTSAVHFLLTNLSDSKVRLRTQTQAMTRPKASRESPSFIISYECLGLKMNASVTKGLDGIKMKLDEAISSGKGF